MKKNVILKTSVGMLGAFLFSQTTFGQTNTFPTPTGNVGIAVTGSPQQPLHVVGKARFDVNTAGAGGGRFYLTRPAVTNYENFLSFGTNGTSTYEWVFGTGTSASDLGIYNWTHGRVFTVTTTGSTCVGNISTALAKLHVGGDIIASTASTGVTSAGYVKANTAYSGVSSPDFTWYGNLTTGVFHPAANVIGFTNNGTETMRIHSNNFVGIGTNSPTDKLQVHDGAIKITGTNPSGGPMVLFGGSPSSAPNGEYGIEYLSGDKGLNFWKPFDSHNTSGGQGGVNNYIMFLNDDGNVGIGVPPANINSAYKLSVNGSIRAEEVVVEVGWADFVFEKDYKLATLSEVEKFIQKNGHLPQVPSEKEVKENGVSLGQIEATLLQKIEELTLYMIEMDKKNRELESKIELLNNSNK